MNIDIDDIESRIIVGIYGGDHMSDTQRDDAFAALAEILAEVETLRAAEVDRLRAQVAERALGVSLHKAADRGAKDERAAVVAWLQQLRLNQPHGATVVSLALHMIEDAIKRGEHRREEKP